MSDTVNTDTDTVPVAEVDIAGQIIKDPEIRKLPAGSKEYEAAVKNLAEKKAEEATANADENEPRKKSKSGLEKRFSELTSARDAEKQRADALEKRLAEIEQANKNSPNTETVQIPTEEFSVQRPKIDNFNSYDEYMEALADWKIEKKDFDKSQAVYIEEVKKRQAETITNWETREIATKERVEGYDQLVDQEFIQKFSGVDASGKKTKSGFASSEAMSYILESEAGPDLLYELAEDDEKLEKFKSMSAVKQVAFLSRLEMNYEDSSVSKEKRTAKVSKAPEPSKALPKGKAVPARNADPRNGFSSHAEFMEWRKAQKK